jgi:type II secretory pathway component PulJ
VQAQHFAWKGQPTNGQIQITQAEWRNGSNVTIQAAELECIQYGANNQPLSQLTKVLNGPVQPGQTINIQPFTLGAEAQGAANMKCGIVAVQPAN